MDELSIFEIPHPIFVDRQKSLLIVDYHNLHPYNITQIISSLLLITTGPLFFVGEWNGRKAWLFHLMLAKLFIHRLTSVKCVKVVKYHFSPLYVLGHRKVYGLSAEKRSSILAPYYCILNVMLPAKLILTPATSRAITTTAVPNTQRSASAVWDWESMSRWGLQQYDFIEQRNDCLTELPAI